MGNFSNTLFSTLLGWLRNAAAWLWAFLSDPQSGGMIVWIADNWLPLVILLCVACMLIDFIVNLFRWQPHKVWASFFRRLFGHDREESDTKTIRRRWIHADGTTSIEEVDPAEMIPEEKPEPAFVPQPAEEAVNARYARFARPQTEPAYVQPTAVEPMQPEPIPEPVASVPQPEPTERTTRSVTARRRRYAAPESELPLRYSPPPAIEDVPAYHEPYYPPQWKRPADTGSSGIDLGGGGR